MRRLAVACGAAIAISCAGPPVVQRSGEGERFVPDKPAYFDVATCGPRPLQLYAPLSAEALAAYLSASEPWVTECLVDARVRKGNPRTETEVQATVRADGTKYEVSGANLTKQAIACIEDSFQRLGKLPSIAPGTPPVAAKIRFVHLEGRSPSVKLGQGEAPDLAAALRLQLPAWCSCFDSWKDRAPKGLLAEVKVRPHAAGEERPVEVEFELTNESASDDVTICLKRKMESFEVRKLRANRISLGVPFYFVHSGVSEPVSGSPPSIQLVQLDSVRRQRSASVGVRSGVRKQAASTYQAMASRGRPRARDLSSACSDLVKADEAWLAALGQQLDVEDQIVTLTGELAAKEAAWKVLDGQAREGRKATESDLDKLRKVLAEDRAICPARDGT